MDNPPVPYSGKTTGNNPIGMDLSNQIAIQQMTIFDVQWSDCPVEVEEDVRRLWQDYWLNNDNCIYKYHESNNEGTYPSLEYYLSSRGIKQCWIHWWW